MNRLIEMREELVIEGGDDRLELSGPGCSTTLLLQPVRKTR